MDNLDPERPAAPRPRLGGLSRRAATVATTAGLMVGGLAGGYLIGHAATTTTDTTTATSTPSSSTGTAAAAATPAPGTFKSNEDTNHEAGESAAREAQENAGQAPTVP
jgi:hypothetical protein